MAINTHWTRTLDHAIQGHLDLVVLELDQLLLREMADHVPERQVSFHATFVAGLRAIVVAGLSTHYLV
jgi:hypothetical protein